MSLKIIKPDASASETRISMAAWVLVCGITLFLPITLYVAKAVAPLFAILACALLALRMQQGLSRPALSITEWILTAFVALSFLSSIWAPLPYETLRTLVSLAATFSGACLILRQVTVLNLHERKILRRAIISGGSMGYTILGIALLGNGSIMREIWLHAGRSGTDLNYAVAIKTSIVVAGLYLWPWGLALIQEFGARVGLAVIAIIMATIVVVFSPSDAIVVALVCGLLAALAALALKQRAPAYISAVLAVVVFAMPLIVKAAPDPLEARSHLEFLPNSAVHRVNIWQNTEKRIEERPLLGFGFNSSRLLYGPETQRTVLFLPDTRRIGARSEPIPLHPHNAILQIWLELGLVGAVIAAFFVGFATRTMLERLRHWPNRFFGTGLFISTMVIATVSFGAWQGWWLCTIALLAAMIQSLTAATTTLDQVKNAAQNLR
jgi:exopolysaccharide production protein ExoQ